MKIISWNCRGLGCTQKDATIKDLVKMEKPMVLLIQETKMKSKDAIQMSKQPWISSEGIVEDYRGTLGGLCSLWNPQELSLKFSRFKIIQIAKIFQHFQYLYVG